MKAAGTVTALQDRRRVLEGQAQNLGEAIAKMGHSATLLQQLASVESESSELMNAWLWRITRLIWHFRWNWFGI